MRFPSSSRHGQNSMNPSHFAHARYGFRMIDRFLYWGDHVFRKAARSKVAASPPPPPPPPAAFHYLQFLKAPCTRRIPYRNACPGYPYQRSEYRVTVVQCHTGLLNRAVAAKNEDSKQHGRNKVTRFTPFY